MHPNPTNKSAEIQCAVRRVSKKGKTAPIKLDSVDIMIMATQQPQNTATGEWRMARIALTKNVLSPTSLRVVSAKLFPRPYMSFFERNMCVRAE